MNTYIIVLKRILIFVKSNPTPNGMDDDLLEGVTWPVWGSSGAHLEIDKHLTVGRRPTKLRVELYELANGITLPLQTGCTMNLLSAISN